MNSAALASKSFSTEEPSNTRHSSTSGLHARPNDQPVRVTVITGGLSRHLNHPLHARAVQASTLCKTQFTESSQRHQKIEGVAFNLTRRERLLTLCAGTLFFTISLFTILL